MKHILVFNLLFLSTICLSQKRIIKIDFEKQDSNLLYKYFDNDVFPMSQTQIDLKATGNGIYYGDTISKYKNIRTGLAFVDFYGGLSIDSLLKYEIKKGKTFLVMDVIKLKNYKKVKIYQNGIVYQKLNRKLEKGKKYKCSLNYSINEKQTNLKINGFGFLFTKYKDSINTNQYLRHTPQVYSKKFLKFENNKWQLLEGEFIADADYDCIMIGFFEPRNSFKLETINRKLNNAPEIIEGFSMRIRIDDIEVFEVK